MIGAIAWFEIRGRFRLISTWIYFGIFLALSFLAALAAGGAFTGASVSAGSGKVFANSPYLLAGVISALAEFGVLVVAVIAGRAVQQDFEYGVHPFFFSAPISKWQLLLGRFLGALVVSSVILASIGLGLWAGYHSPWVDAKQLGPAVRWAYVQPYLTFVLPSVLFSGALFFGVAALARKMLPVYVGSILLVVGNLIAGALTRDLDNKHLAALIDPFGSNAFENVTRYWSIAEKNTRLIPLTGDLLVNRVIWVALGLAVLAFCMWRFRFAQHVSERAKKAQAEPVAPTPSTPASQLKPTLRYGWRRDLGLVPSLSWMLFRDTVKNVYFAAIVFAGLLFVFGSAKALGSMFGTNTYPVTYQVLGLLGGGFGIFFLVLITFYAGELVWRERDAKVAQIEDALPVADWVPLLSKLLALVGVQVFLLGVLLVSGVLIQTFKGYHHYELGLYVHQLFGINLVGLALLCVLAITVQTVVNHKYVGHVVMVLYFVLTLFASTLGFEHNLYRYSHTPGCTYSDMNGFGHCLGPQRWFELYWALFAVLLALGTRLLWVRGTDPGWRERRRRISARFGGKVALTAAVTLALLVGVGGYIFYNTNILNPYRTSVEQEALSARYEKAYKHLEGAPQPRIVAVKVDVDLHPKTPSAHVRGTYRLRNKTGAPLSTIYVSDVSREVAPEVTQEALTLDREAKRTDDDLLGFHTFELAKPLAPGEELSLSFAFAIQDHGFTNSGMETEVVHNGTFFSSTLSPHLGYQPTEELTDDSARRKQGLKEKERLRDLNDPKGRLNTYIANDADWIDFDATVSTAPDQIALAPGTEVRRWTQNGRAYFQYHRDRMLNFYAFLSARYAVKTTTWNGVKIEVLYHPEHPYDVDAMLAAAKASLAYCSKNFGPYPDPVLRIAEFPRYASYAQSFPANIPFSEAIGFIAKVDPSDPKDVNYPYFVTAHEVAHQWWAHQVIGANVQGETMLSESFAEYTALMVLKHKYGVEGMRRFLKYELDGYLRGRGMERKKELPLERVEDQGYIRYQKGGMAMYALQDMVGEDTVNSALKSFRDQVAYQEPPYAISTQFVDALRKVVPADHAYLVHDLFEAITLYENRAVSATYRPLGKGQYEVTLQVKAKKVQADATGNETEVPLNDWIDIGLLDDAGRVAYRVKKRITAPETTFKLDVNWVPAKAGIDPLNELIDRDADDNVIKVERSAS